MNGDMGHPRVESRPATGQANSWGFPGGIAKSWLVGGWDPLKNMNVNWDDEIPNINGNIKLMATKPPTRLDGFCVSGKSQSKIRMMTFGVPIMNQETSIFEGHKTWVGFRHLLELQRLELLTHSHQGCRFEPKKNKVCLVQSRRITIYPELVLTNGQKCGLTEGRRD